MRKYYTIEKTLHCDKKSLVAMIETILGNRKNPNPEKNFSAGKNPKKKLARRAD